MGQRLTLNPLSPFPPRETSSEPSMGMAVGALPRAAARGAPGA